MSPWKPLFRACIIVAKKDIDIVPPISLLLALFLQGIRIVSSTSGRVQQLESRCFVHLQNTY